MKRLKEGLTGHLLIRNGEAFDYCWKEAVASIIDVCDEFIVLEAHSDLDDTYEQCLALRDKYHPKLRVIRGEWDANEPEGHEYLRLSRLTNQCIEACKTKWNWAIQGDEAYLEFGLDAVRDIVEGQTRFRNDVRACYFRAIHFVGNPWTHFPFMYSHALRMARTDSSWRSVGDACGYEMFNPMDGFVVAMGAPLLFHYGKLGHPFKKLAKQVEFQEMFHSRGFPDPKVLEMADKGDGMNYAYLFEAAKSKGLFQEYKGPHPAVMADWLAAHSKWWETFTNG